MRRRLPAKCRKPAERNVDFFIDEYTNAFAAYGGVPRLLTIDNLKAGVTKHSSDELVLNPTYREFSEHFNVAVIPHAPRYPRGKASVESSVGKIANKVRNMLRDQVFFSFEELNEAIA